MERRRQRPGNLRYGFMAVVIAMVLWGIAHGSSRAEKNVDIPVVFYGLPDDAALFQHRVLKEAIHELGHTLGLSHCGNRRCVMHFSNSLSDTDIKGQDLCLNCRSLLEDEQ